MKKYEISHLDGGHETFIVEAETAGKAKAMNYYDWSEVFRGTFGEYLERLNYCRVVRGEAEGRGDERKL